MISITHSDRDSNRHLVHGARRYLFISVFSAYLCCSCHRLHDPRFTLTIRIEPALESNETKRSPFVALDMENTGRQMAHLSRESLNQGLILEVRTAQGRMLPLTKRSERLKIVKQTNLYHGGEDIKRGRAATFLIGLGDFVKLPQNEPLTLRIRWTLNVTEQYAVDDLPREGTERSITLTSNTLPFVAKGDP
jgi:hypothetical protein